MTELSTPEIALVLAGTIITSTAIAWAMIRAVDHPEYCEACGAECAADQVLCDECDRD